MLSHWDEVHAPSPWGKGWGEGTRLMLPLLGERAGVRGHAERKGLPEMTNKEDIGNLTEFARALRERQTEAESLVWSLLRGRRICNLKFRRQHPIPPYIADFACVEKMLVVEIDGGYHDYVADKDEEREQFIRAKGWGVLRFENEDVLEDVESIGIAIANRLGLEYTFKRREDMEK